MKNKSAQPSLPPAVTNPEERLKFFTKVTQAIASDLDLQRTLYTIVDEVFQYFRPRGASIMVKDGNLLRVVAGRSISQTTGQTGRPKDLPSFKVGEGVAGEAALLGKPVFVEDTLEDRRFHRIPGKVSSIRAILAVPMKISGRVTGVINVAFATPHHFTDEEIQILEIIAAPSAYAIQNSTLFEKIDEERQKLELIQTSMQGGLTVSKLDGTILFINDAAHSIYGISRDVVGLTFQKLIASQDKYFNFPLEPDEGFDRVIKEVSSGKVIKVKTTISSKPPRVIEAIYAPLLNSQRQVIGVIGNHRDITELVSQADQISSQLIQSEAERERWEAIFDNVEEAIVVTDHKGVILRSNPAAEILSGLSEKEIVGKDFGFIFPLFNQRGIAMEGELSPGRMVLRTKEPIEYLEAKFHNSEGREIWLGISVSPTLGRVEGSQNLEVIYVMRDVSRLKEIDKAKTDFVSMASHELRTPLTVINGYISLFMSGDLGNIDSPDMVHYRRVFEQISRSTKRLNDLVEDLLNVTRIEQGRINLALEKMNLDLLVKDVVQEMDTHAKSKNHKLKLDASVASFLDLPPIIKGDHDKIRQVLINLIDNAIKYTKPGGEIVVGVKKDRHEVIVTVQDSGIGMPRQLLPRIFEKFQRLEGSYVKDSVGTGLGLFIVRELIKAHGGRVWVESQVGKGSKFFFSLPLSRD